MSEELAKVVSILAELGQRHGQIQDPVGFTSMCALLKLIDSRHGTKLYEYICTEYIKVSRSAPSYFDTYIIKLVKSIAQGITHQTMIQESLGKVLPVVEPNRRLRNVQK